MRFGDAGMPILEFRRGDVRGFRTLRTCLIVPSLGNCEALRLGRIPPIQWI